jgi:hypothetical protein
MDLREAGEHDGSLRDGIVAVIEDISCFANSLVSLSGNELDIRLKKPADELDSIQRSEQHELAFLNSAHLFDVGLQYLQNHFTILTNGKQPVDANVLHRPSLLLEQ